jgi:hypothetical protein
VRLSVASAASTVKILRIENLLYCRPTNLSEQLRQGSRQNRIELAILARRRFESL